MSVAFNISEMQDVFSVNLMSSDAGTFSLKKNTGR